jgi:hypothetical protein
MGIGQSPRQHCRQDWLLAGNDHPGLHWVAAGANPVIDPMAVVLMCLVFNLSSLSFCE